MEGDRKAYSEESRIMIGKQRYLLIDLKSRASIEKFKRDNTHLIDELRLLEKRTDDKKRHGAASKKAEALAEQAGMHVYLIKYSRGLSKKDTPNFNRNSRIR